MTVHDGVWAELRRCYCETAEPVAQLSKRFGVTSDAIKWLREKEDWGARPAPPRKPVKKKSPTKKRKAPAKVAVAPRTARSGPDASGQRIQRLFNLIDLQLDNLETLMTAEPLSAEDEVRTSRVMQAIVGNLEKVTDAAKVADAPKEQSPLDAVERANKAERLRREIAERLERLNAQWNTPLPAEKKTEA
jgi:hypothetical protein